MPSRVAGVEAQAKVCHKVQAAAGPAAMRLAHHHHAQCWQLRYEVQALHQLHNHLYLSASGGIAKQQAGSSDMFIKEDRKIGRR